MAGMLQPERPLGFAPGDRLIFILREFARCFAVLTARQLDTQAETVEGRADALVPVVPLA